LRETIVAAEQGDQPLIQALAAYERQMIDHGFRFVRATLDNMARFHTESRVGRAFTKAFFRIVDRVPPLQTAMLGSR
jgi:2-polyprenyl-6-methoxyphenol hydroxylase-like FAD-dependent oxidoreductase